MRYTRVYKHGIPVNTVNFTYDRRPLLYYQILLDINFPIVSVSVLPAASSRGTLPRCKNVGILFNKPGACKATTSVVTNCTEFQGTGIVIKN